MPSGRALAEAVFAAIDDKRSEAFSDFFAAQGSFTFGNHPAVVGRPAIADACDRVLGALAAISHDIRDVWEHDRTVVVRLAVTYTRRDGRSLTLPCCNIWQRDAAGEIADYRIYMDISPVFA